MSDIVRTCNVCDEEKDISLFPKNKNRAEGHGYSCKVCANDMTKNYKENNKVKIQDYNKKYREEHKDELNENQRLDPVIKNNNKLEYRKKYYEALKKIIEDKGGKCLSELKDYETAHSKLNVECQDEHEFITTSNHLKANKWCPVCCIKQGELISVKILEHLTGKIFRKIRPEWLKRDDTGLNLELDGFNEELQLAIEYQGIQHYKQIAHFFKSEAEYKKRQEYDQFKRDKCIENGITLFEIPYNIKHGDLYDHIVNLCEEYDYLIDKNKEFNLQECYNIIPKINEASKIIEEKKGRLITNPSSISMLSKFEVECEKGHCWETYLKNLKKGAWCVDCAKIRTKNTKEKISDTLKEFYSTSDGKIKKEESFVKRSETMAKQRTELRKNITEKLCKNCNEVKNLSEFCKKSNAKDGLQPYCRFCINEIKKKSRELNNIILEPYYEIEEE